MKKFINPRIDFAFKKIFGSENSREINISFLNAILGFEGDSRIVDLTIAEPYNLPEIKGLKESWVDVKVKTAGGKSIIIEMQVLNHSAFKRRILYNAAKQYSNQIEKADHYLDLAPVIALTITDFELFEETEKYINFFILTDVTCTVFAMWPQKL